MNGECTVQATIASATEGMDLAGGTPWGNTRDLILKKLNLVKAALLLQMAREARRP